MLCHVLRTTIAVAILGVFSSGTFAQKAVKGPLSPMDVVKFAQAKKKSDGGKKDGRFIIEGDPAPAGLYPFQVSLIIAQTDKGDEFNGHFCGGSLISSTWILTAAHCVTVDDGVSAPGEINAYVGSPNFKGGDRIAVKAVHRHPDYVHSVTEHDVALLELSRAPRSGLKYATVDLVGKDTEQQYTKAGTPVSIVGWGTTENDELSEQLRHTSIKMVERAECNANIKKSRMENVPSLLSDIVQQLRIPPAGEQKVYEAISANVGTIVTDAMICAGEPRPGATVSRVRDTCQGDSGGPLLAKSNKGAFIQVGIVSWGEGCGIPLLHGVYTRLAIYADWVKSTMTKR
jgi:secreted trypsin-like serine protease